MSGGVDEIEAAVHAVVDDVAAVESTLVLQVSLELLVDVGDDVLEAVGVVDGVAVPRGVHHCQPHLRRQCSSGNRSVLAKHCVLHIQNTRLLDF